MNRVKKFMNGVKEFISYLIESVLNIIFCMFIFIGIATSIVISCIYYLYELFESIED